MPGRIQVVAPFHTRRLPCYRHKINKNCTPDHRLHEENVSEFCAPCAIHFQLTKEHSIPNHEAMVLWRRGLTLAPATAASLVTPPSLFQVDHVLDSNDANPLRLCLSFSDFVWAKG